MSAAQGKDMFATVVWPGASNATARLQLVSLDAGGAMSVYGSAEIAETPRSFARLQTYGGDAAVAGEFACRGSGRSAPGPAGSFRNCV